jgi:hypothetical protein
MLTNWERYRKLLKEKVDDAKHNLDLYERKHKEAKVIYEIALRGQDTFEQELDKKLDELEEQWR